jgi:hypothetical protein
MKRQDTAGKGPGLVLRADNGAMRLTLSDSSKKGSLEILEVGGRHASVAMKPSDLKALARALLKVAQALEIEATSDEVTQH